MEQGTARVRAKEQNRAPAMPEAKAALAHPQSSAPGRGSGPSQGLAVSPPSPGTPGLGPPSVSLLQIWDGPSSSPRAPWPSQLWLFLPSVLRLGGSCGGTNPARAPLQLLCPRLGSLWHPMDGNRGVGHEEKHFLVIPCPSGCGRSGVPGQLGWDGSAPAGALLSHQCPQFVPAWRNPGWMSAGGSGVPKGVWGSQRQRGSQRCSGGAATPTNFCS